MTETVSIDEIVIDASDVLTIEDRGGWNAPSRKTERGFEYDSYVNAEPVEVSIEALVERERYDDLAAIRDQDEPIDGASIGQVVLAKAKLDSLETVNEATPANLVRCSIQLSEIQEAATETATVTLDLDNEQSTAAEDTDASSEQTEGDSVDGGDGDDGGEADAVADDEGFLDGVAESIDAFNDELSASLFGGSD